MPVAASTWRTRSAGTLRHWPIACGVIPIWRLSPLGPPTLANAALRAICGDAIMQERKHSFFSEASDTFLALESTALHIAGMTLPGRHLLRAARKKRGLTQAKLGEAIGVTGAAVGQWERGDDDPSTANLTAVIKLLELSYSDLVGGTFPEEAASLTTPSNLSKNGDSVVDVSYVKPMQLEAQDGVEKKYPLGAPVLRAAVTIDGQFPMGEETGELAPLPPGLAHVEGVFAMMVTDPTMGWPFEGAGYIYFQSNRKPNPRDLALIEFTNGNAIVRMFLRETETTVICRQANPEREVEFDKSVVKAMHRIFTPTEWLRGRDEAG